VTRLATLLPKAAVMGVSVAIVALAERYTRVAWFAINSRSVTLVAGHLGMQARQGVTGLGMIEIRLVNFPVVVVVAVQAVLAQPPIVGILVASDAGG